MTDAQPSWKTVLPFLVGVALCVILATFNQIRDFELWRNYALSGFFIGGTTTLILYRLDVRIPHYIQWCIVGALLTHYVGGSLGSPDPYRMGLLGMHGINGAYHTFHWWDHLTHGVGIGATSMGIAYLVEVYQVRRGLNWSASSVFILSLLAALTTGVGVELYEYLGKTAFQTIDQGGYENTMRDLWFNLIGAIVGTGLATTVNRISFHERIQARWGPPVAGAATRRWWTRVPPAMAGFIVFVSIPAGAALFLASQFFANPLPPDDLAMYDPALMVLVQASGIAMVLGPVTSQMHRRLLRRATPAPEGE